MSSSITVLNEKKGGFDQFIKYVLTRNFDIVDFDKAKEAYEQWKDEPTLDISRYVRRIPKQEEKFLRNLYKETMLDIYENRSENEGKTREELFKQEPKREEVFEMKLPQQHKNLELIEAGQKKVSATISVSKIINNIDMIASGKKEETKKLTKDEKSKFLGEVKKKYPSYIYLGVLQASMNKQTSEVSLRKFNAVKKFLDAYDEYEEGYQANLQVVNTNFNVGENHDEFSFVDYAKLPLTWKKSRRELFVEIAKNEGAQYLENIHVKEYMAGVKSKNGVVTKIVSKSENDISFTAHDKNGRAVPVDLKYFEAAMKLARETGKPIKFGNFKNSETRARLLLACMVSDLNNDKKVNIFNMPSLDDGFWNEVDPATRAEIEKMKDLSEGKKQETTKENVVDKKIVVKKKPEAEVLSKTSVGELQDLFTNSTVARFNELSGKYADETATAREKAEVEFIRDFTLHGKGLRENFEKSGSYEYSLKEFYGKDSVVPSSFISQTRKQQAGWNLVLNVVPNKKDPLTGQIMSFLRKNDINYFVGKGLTSDASMVISAGSYTDMKKLSKILSQKFGKDLPEINRASKISDLAKHLDSKMLAYFNVDKVFVDGKGHKLFDFEGNPVVKGISLPNLGENRHADMNLIHQSILKGLVSREGFDVVHEKTAKIQELGAFADYYAIEQARAFGAHKLYSEVLGEHYHGKDKKLFEKEMFSDALPKEGTQERKDLDVVTIAYANEIKKEKAESLELFKEVQKEYVPISVALEAAFSKAPQKVH